MAHESSPPSIDIRYVANLARLDLTEEEVERFGAQLQGVMEHIDKLSEVDVTGIEATAHATEMQNRVRQDVPHPGIGAEAFLQNAPDQAAGQLRVPKVVDA